MTPACCCRSWWFESDGRRRFVGDKRSPKHHSTGSFASVNGARILGVLTEASIVYLKYIVRTRYLLQRTTLFLYCLIFLTTTKDKRNDKQYWDIDVVTSARLDFYPNKKCSILLWSLQLYRRAIRNHSLKPVRSIQFVNH